MNKKLKIYSLLLSSFCLSQVPLQAHDDLIYATTTQWSADYGNNGTINLQGAIEADSKVFFGDYNGDGLIDMCVVRFGGDLIEWEWRLNNGEGGWTPLSPFWFGISAVDQAVVGDFNGDGKTDIAVVRQDDSSIFAGWYIDYAPCDAIPDVEGVFGLKGDIPLSGDFNADGVDDLCVYRPSTGTWYVAFSDIKGYPDFISPLAINGVHFGEATDLPVVGDFNGDGYADMAIYKRESGKTIINLHDRNKPRFERLADKNGNGTNDMEITSSLSETVVQVLAADLDNSRPMQLPLATEDEYGWEVHLRHGWTCIFDNSLNVDKWVQALQAAGINTLEYHPWMRAHEEIAPVADTWNTYVGDDRLWTSKRIMKEKIDKFRAVGGRSIGYTGIYAATPAFANDHPAWAMRHLVTNNIIEYGNGYLNLMSVNEHVNHPYEVNGITFKNFNDYFVHQAELAQTEYNWDGWRWDWYGLPDRYVCSGLVGEGDFTYEMAPMVERLNLAAKEIRTDATTTALQLPTASGNIPNLQTAAVADHQFMELWPFATGEKYTDLYHDMYTAKSLYPDKPVFGNFYPPAEMNLTTSWPLVNVDYQFATSLAAGGYPAAISVDGVAGFTDPVPFHAVNYPKEVLERIAQWNDFVKAYGPYLYYSNPAYLITDYVESNLSTGNASDGLFVKLKKRRDKRTQQIDAFILNVINYGNSIDLKWVERNEYPTSQSLTATFSLPEGFSPKETWLITAEGREQLSYTLTARKLQVSIPQVTLFASLLITSENAAEIPAEPVKNPYEFPDMKFEYDAAGETLRADDVDHIIIMDEEQLPLETGNKYNDAISTWEVITDAYAGENAIRVTPGMLTIPSTTESAIRVPINKFMNFQVAIRANETAANWIGFRLIQPSETSPVWQSRDLFYRIGDTQPNLAYITIFPMRPQSGVWKEYNRNIQEDVISLFGEEWKDAIVVAVHYGPIQDGTADYDRLIFTSNDYNSIESSKKKDNAVTIYPNPLTGEQVTIIAEAFSDGDNYQVELLDLLGRTCAVYALSVQGGELHCQLPALTEGYYLIRITDVVNGNINTTLKVKYK